MRLYESNRLEELLAALAEVVAVPLPSPLVPEVIVVQSHGMQRWLSLQLGQRLGVWANAAFPFPRAFVEGTLAAVLGEPLEAARAFTRDALTWAVAKRLPELAGERAFRPVAAYLGDDRHGPKCFELAERVADLFDQYAVYRPDLVLGWDHGEEQHWQAVLWRSVVAEHGPHHVAARFARFREHWRRLRALPSELPRRVSVFGVSSLPPAYVELLSLLSDRLEVRVFRLSPADRTASAREHPLVASLGRAGRELEQVLEAVAGAQLERLPAYRDPGTGSLLSALQSDLLAGRQRGRDAPPLVIPPEDDSIAVHACHSPLRELEVLRDQLIHRFERDPTLLPHEVVVLTPDLDRYAPLVDAVFGGDPEQPGYVPYRVADRNRRGSSPLPELLLTLLALVRGRMTASAVVDLLHSPAVRRRFGLPDEALPTLVRWIQDSGVRWGVDAEDRVLAHQPAFEANTWRFGWSRLWLGYAMGTGDDGLFAGVLPVGGAEGAEAEWLGSLAELCSVLFSQRKELRAARSPASWHASVAGLCEAMLAVTDSSHWELELVLGALDEFRQSAELAGFSGPVELEWLTRWLGERLGAERASHEFMAGGVTFCALLPMRSIPFRVVCLLGMDDGVFPRVRRAPSFDLIAAQPELGDRSLRDEDRQLFLELLLAARQELLISYVGRSVRDHAELPPSVVLGELIDHLDQAYRAAQGPGVGTGRVVEHPLQAHSPRYFGGDSRSGRVSYHGRAAEGARALVLAQAMPTEPRPFFATPLPPEPAPTLQLSALARFLREPLTVLVNERLGLELKERFELVSDREPIELDALAQHELGEFLLEHASVRLDPETLGAMLRGSGQLPLGTPGECHYRVLLPEVTALLQAAAACELGAKHPPRQFALDCAGKSLIGTLGNLWDGGLVRTSYGRVRAKGELGAWVEHLVWQCIAPPEHVRRTVLIGRSSDHAGPCVLVFRPLLAETAQTRLEELVRFYELGQRVPLPFFPESARAYVARLREDGGPADALRAARERYRPSELSRARGEADSPEVELVFGDADPLDPAFRMLPDHPSLEPPGFAELAQAVYGPLLDALEAAP